MPANPIFEENWRVKDRLVAEAGHDMRRFCDQLKAWSAEHPQTGTVVHSAEELRQLTAKRERQRADNQALIVREKSPGEE